MVYKNKEKHPIRQHFVKRVSFLGVFWGASVLCRSFLCCNYLIYSGAFVYKGVRG